MDFINQNEWNVNAMVEVLETFRSSVEAGWGAFVSLGDWEKRNDVIHAALSSPDIRALFLERYRQHMEPYFREEFYSLLESKKLEYYADLYETTGEINIPLLKQKCLKDIATWSMSMESIGNSRYGTHRTVYPPGEAMRFPDTDPRKHLVSETNLTAIAKRHMSGEEAVQWIYQSPHLQLFVQGVMRMTDIYPYHSDLGVAVNIMRPTDHQATKNALAFHFDTIDSSVKVGGDVYGADNRNARGATGVIGIQDCLVEVSASHFPQFTERMCARCVTLYGSITLSRLKRRLAVVSQKW